MRRIIPAFVAIALAVIPAAAQTSDAALGRARALAEASRLADAGDIFAARRMIDSLARITTSDSAAYADILFARATVAPSVLDASLDYEKIVAELPHTPAARASLLRLAQRALISSDAVKALDYLQRILREYPDDASVAEAQYWRTRALLEAHDIAAACSANREARAHAESAHSALTSAIESQGFIACGSAPAAKTVTRQGVATPKNVTPTGVPVTEPTSRATASPRLKYAVQVAAYRTRRDADAMAQRLKGKGLDAHVDGSVNPFRVRIGHYATYADAAKAMRDLKARKISGFVSEIKE